MCETVFSTVKRTLGTDARASRPPLIAERYFGTTLISPIGAPLASRAFVVVRGRPARGRPQAREQCAAPTRDVADHEVVRPSAIRQVGDADGALDAALAT